MIAIAVTMATIFAISYSLVLGRATPHRIIIELVGSRAEDPALVAALVKATHGGLSFRPYGTVAAAEEAIDQQATYAALVLDRGAPHVLVSSASSAQVAQVLEKAAEQVDLTTGQRIDVIDLHPLPPSDPQGLVSFYMTLAASIVGFVTMFQMRANAPGFRLRDWLALIALLAVAGGLVLALVADPLIGRAAWTVPRAVARPPGRGRRGRAVLLDDDRPGHPLGHHPDLAAVHRASSAPRCTSEMTSTRSRSSFRAPGSSAFWPRS